MIDIKALEKNEENAFMKMGYADGYRKSLELRGADPSAVDQLIELNKKRKAHLTEAEAAKAKQNKTGGEIAKKKKAGESGEDLLKLLEEMSSLSEKHKELVQKANEADEEVTDLLLGLPNILHFETPAGKGEVDNKVVREWGDNSLHKNFKAKEHWQLGEEKDIIDFDRAAKVTGARFSFLKGKAARIERALIQFMMDMHADKHAYEEMIPPFIANADSYRGTGQFPKFKEDVFQLTGHEYYLIPTAEVPVTNYYRDETLKAEDLPKSFVAYSPCFRSEAGSYGKDTKGLIRQHQFNKVELVKFVRPEESEAAHDELTSHAENVLQALELPYRASVLCSKDIGFGAMKCFDLEVWLPGQNAYREISSCSNFGDFQARRANIRFKEAKGKPQFVHTLNGSGLAIGRTLIALLENGQQEDGTIKMPKALQPYLGFDTI